MRRQGLVLFILIFAASFIAKTATAIPETKKAPAQIVFKTKMGDVTFPHSEHVKREGKCEVCHDAVFPKDATAPLNYKPNMHKDAEAKKTSCATCHVANGKAFVTKGNCARCHHKGK